MHPSCLLVSYMPLASTGLVKLLHRAVLRKPKNTASEAEQRAEAPTSDSASLRSLDVHNAILRQLQQQ